MFSMENNRIDETFAPLSKWIAKTFFNEQYGRTWSQKVEDEQGLPKQIFHNRLIGAGILIGALWYFSRED